MSRTNTMWGSRKLKAKRKRKAQLRKIDRANAAYDKLHGGARTVKVLNPTTRPISPKLIDRLRAIGYESYDAYLRSTHWKRFKERYKSTGMPGSCHVCNQPRAQLHHISYDRLGKEEVTDVIPLCQKHHSELHEYARIKGLPVSETQRMLRELYGHLLCR